MTRILRYAGVCLAIAALTVGIAWAGLDRGLAQGVLAAAVVAVPVQVVAFTALVRATVGTNRFLLVWLGGTVVRLFVVSLGGWALVELFALPPAPTLLSLAGLLFVMLLLEPVFLGLPGTRTTRDQRQA